MPLPVRSALSDLSPVSDQATVLAQLVQPATGHFRNHRQSGGTAIGFLVGVTVGLAIATAVALLVTRAPMPYVNKSKSVSASVITNQSGRLPDPNIALVNPEPQRASSTDDTDAAAAAKPVESSAYMLQAGAYRSEVDAQSMRARLALIGYEARIRSALVKNETLYRVRLGPFNALDKINTARAELANNGIEASVVRQ